MTKLEKTILELMKAVTGDENYTLEQLDEDFLAIEIEEGDLHWGYYGKGDQG